MSSRTAILDSNEERQDPQDPLLSAPSSARSLSRTVADNGKAVETADPEDEQIQGGGSIVQFSAPIYYGDKREGSIAIDIVRHGGLQARSACKFETVDSGAKAGVAYVGTFCEVVFEKGEQTKSVEVPLLRSGIWAATLEFKVKLSEPENCTLGAYLHMGRVKVIDDGHFPSSKFGEALEKGKVAGIPGLALFWEFFKWTFMQEGMGWKTILSMFFDQFRNIYMVIVIWADMYYVNVVLSPKESAKELLVMPTRDETVYLLAAIHILPFAALHLWDWAKVKMDILGNLQLHLQKCLFRKYLNLSDTSKDDVPPELLQVAIMNEAGLVASGYLDALALLVTAGNIAINFAFIMMRTPKGVIYGLAVPALVLSWALFRNSCFNIRAPRAETASLAHYTIEACQKDDLIASFQLRPQMNAGFSKRADAVRTVTNTRSAFFSNTNFVLQWLSPLAVGAYMVYHTNEVVDEELPLGRFLATLAVIKKLSADSLHFYGTFNQLNLTLPVLRNVAIMLNKETTVYRWKEIMRQRRSTTTTTLQQMAGTSLKDGSSHSDSLPITCKHLDMSIIPGKQVLHGVNLNFYQDKLIIVTGPHGSGKTTLLSLIAHKLFPTSGEVFVPSHLRTLLVPSEPLFLDRSLLENLTLGNPNFTQKNLPRLKAILGDLGMEKAIEAIDREASGPEHLSAGKWLRNLTSSERHLLALARAFSMNPEVLLLQRPFGHYHTYKQGVIRRLILEHRQNRGLHLPKDAVRSRRPRTVFFTADSAGESEDADVVVGMVPSRAKDAGGAWTCVQKSADAVVEHEFSNK